MRSVALLALTLLLFAGGCGTGLSEVRRVVLVTFDTTRADRIGAYGYDGNTSPNVDSLAAEGTLFLNAVSPAPTTMPSHSTMMTGLYPPDHGVRYNLFYKLDSEVLTLAERLKERGFATAGFPASHIVSKKFGIDQGFDHWVEPPTVDEGDPDSDHPVASMRSAEKGVDQALEWLSQQGDQPVFFWLHFYDPHWPYIPEFPYSAQFPERPYEAEIAYTDAQFGRLLERLRSDEQWDETMVIVAGDHGEGMFDHDEQYHSMLVYESTQHVPLIMRVPGSSGVEIERPVSLADITPTVLDVAHVPLRKEDPLRGISLKRAIQGEEPPIRALYFESLTGAIAYGWAELQGVRVGDWKLIDSFDPELFNLAEDAGEHQNLSTLEPTKLSDYQAEVEDILNKKLGNFDDTEVNLSEEEKNKLASLGYVAGSSSRSAGGTEAPHPRKFVSLQREILLAQTAARQRRWAQVEDVCRYVLERDPTNRWGLQSLTVALQAMGRPQEALAPAIRLAELAGTPDSHSDVVELLSVLGRQEEALEQVTRALKEHPESEVLKFNKLVVEYDLNPQAACSGSVADALAREPQNWRTLVVSARCANRNANKDRVIALLREALDAGLPWTKFELLGQTAEFSPLKSRDAYDALVSEYAPKDEEAEQKDES